MATRKYSSKVSVAQLESAKKYQAKFTRFQFYVDKERAIEYRKRAEEMGYTSFTQFIIDALEDKMKK